MPEEPKSADVNVGIGSMQLEAVIIRACRFCGGANPNNEPLCPGCGRKGNDIEQLGTIYEWHTEEETDEG